jgi:Tol biopolymer transport system component
MEKKHEEARTMKSKSIVFAGLALVVAFALSGAVQQSAEQLYKSGLYEEEVGGDLQKAIGIYQDILQRFPDNREIAAMAQLQIGVCYEKLGLTQAQEAYQKVIEKYPDQSGAVKAARDKLALLTRTQTAAEKGNKEFRIRRVYDGDGLEWGNGLSSDGRYLVYTDWDTGDLAVVDLVTTKSRPLTNKGGLSTKSPEMGETSAFSPGDKQVAYGWYNKDKVAELWVIDFGGSNPRMLYRDEQSAWLRPHDWTPDGQQILTINMKKDGPSQIALISAADGTIRILREVQVQDPALDLSPDGRFIACSIPPDPKSSKRDIFVVKTDSGEISPLVTHAADDYSLGWAPDGRTVLFASDRTGSYGVWSVQVSDGRAQGSPILIKAGFNKAEPVRLTPDGVIYCIQDQMLCDVYVAAIDPDTGKVQGAPAAVKARYSGANAAPDWSPDGTRLAYRTNPGGMARLSAPAMISVLDVRTGEERQIVPTIDSINFNDGPRWAPDGRSVLVIGTRGEEKGIYRVDVENGAAVPLVIIPQSQYIVYALWSPDAKSIFYPQGNPTRILRRDLDTGKDTELATMTGPAGIPIVALSPDGKWLAFTSQDDGQQLVKLNLVPSAGGEIREVFRSQENEHVRSMNWTPDGRFLWFEKLTFSKDPKVPSKMECWRVSPDGGNLQKLELNYQGLQFRIHPDGRQIAFWTWQGSRDLWALENFLPVDKVKK